MTNLTINMTNNEFNKMYQETVTLKKFIKMVTEVRHNNTDYDKMWKQLPNDQYDDVVDAFITAWIDKAVECGVEKKVKIIKRINNWRNIIGKARTTPVAPVMTMEEKMAALLAKR